MDNKRLRRPTSTASSRLFKGDFMITAIIIGGVLLFGGGVGVGIAVNRDKTAKIIEHQTAMIAGIQDGQRELVEAASKPIILDAELRASLAATPVQCVESLGGSALSLQCSWATCGAFNQSDAGRVECSGLTRKLVERFDELHAAPAPIEL